MKLFKIFILELIKQPKFSVFFCITFSLGLSGFLTTEFLSESIKNSISQKSQEIMGADLSISSRLKIDDKLIDLVEKNHIPYELKSEIRELYTMAQGGARIARLVQLKAIEEGFPFYGSIVIDTGSEKTDLNIQNDDIRIWVYPEIISQLKIQIGDELKIGNHHFKIHGVVTNDSAAGISTSMAPRIYMSQKSLDLTGLVTPQSLVWNSIVYKIAGDSAEDRMNNIVESILNNEILSNDVRVQSHYQSTEQIGRAVNYLNDYLGLVSIASLLLAAIGMIFLFKIFFLNKKNQFAIYLTLGLSLNRLMSLSVTQIVILGLTSYILSVLFSTLGVIFLIHILKELLPVSLNFYFTYSSVLIGLGVAVFGSVLFCLPTLYQIRNVKPLMLFQSEAVNPFIENDLKSFSLYLFPVLFFLSLSIFVSRSFNTGSIFFGSLIATGVILAILFWCASKFIQKYFKLSGKNIFLFSLREIVRKPQTSFILFISLSLGCVLLNVVPQVKSSLNAEFEQPDKSKLPSFFLFDIQEDQLETLKKITSEENISLNQISPLVKARLISVNNEELTVQKDKSYTREQEREERFRNRGINLTYRNQLTESEKIVEGVEFESITKENIEPYLISIEESYAERMNLKIGDILKFDIQNILIEGKVVNLRSVKWTSFQPNFFIQFEEGAIEEAPKSYLASLEDMDFEKQELIQSKIVDKLPNISMVNVTRLVGKLLSVLEQMNWAILLMSMLSIIVGIVVIASVVNYRVVQAKTEIVLLSILGAKNNFVLKSVLIQIFLISFTASFFGGLLGLIVSFILSYFLFDGAWTGDLNAPILLILLIPLIVSAVSYFALFKNVSIKSQNLLMELVR